MSGGPVAHGIRCPALCFPWAPEGSLAFQALPLALCPGRECGAGEHCVAFTLQGFCLSAVLLLVAQPSTAEGTLIYLKLDFFYFSAHFSRSAIALSQDTFSPQIFWWQKRSGWDLSALLSSFETMPVKSGWRSWSCSTWGPCERGTRGLWSRGVASCSVRLHEETEYLNIALWESTAFHPSVVLTSCSPQPNCRVLTLSQFAAPQIPSTKGWKVSDPWPVCALPPCCRACKAPELGDPGWQKERWWRYCPPSEDLIHARTWSAFFCFWPLKKFLENLLFAPSHQPELFWVGPEHIRRVRRDHLAFRKRVQGGASTCFNLFLLLGVIITSGFQCEGGRVVIEWG